MAWSHFSSEETLRREVVQPEEDSGETLLWSSTTWEHLMRNDCRNWACLFQRRKDWEKNLINTYKYDKGRCQGDGVRLFSVVHSDKTRSNGHKLKHKKFHFSMRKNFFLLRVAEHRGHGVSVDFQNPSGNVPASSAGSELALTGELYWMIS